jgi:hypothetical protein
MADEEKREYSHKRAEKRRQETLKMMRRELKDLVKFTKNCREDMHEPDEQDISAVVVGDNLDNAFGKYVSPDGKYQEFVVVLKNGKDGMLAVNLASLIALARKAVIR